MTRNLKEGIVAYHRSSIHLRRSTLLQRHPVLLPVAFIGGALLLGIASAYSDLLFPLLVVFGISPTAFCLSLAFVLWSAGILTGIISILEYIDRFSARVGTFPRSKE